ncbi:CGNR zinc finger domain-containing protein [Natronoglycomyces albus]|uniref:CGNR zinc finger domain-containing protein n=1 Tax=Natronoglycomyces albus TaxID=2811108 RepID=A0A895XH01_9ACTN|nr:CGNR zinc finger domain-containing protein [Natronoglycomyces albus]QSB04187.1 CGNR zinc finger domain-containing protein [Natronoglycomyces albus]
MSTGTVWSDDHFIAGDVALDFANTVYRRTPELGADLLDSPESLFSWLRWAALLPAGDGPALDDDPESVLDEGRTMRQHMWAVFSSLESGSDVPTSALAGLLGVAYCGVRDAVTVGADGSIAPHMVRGALSVLALRSLRLVLSPGSRPLRSCGRCGWFFVDSSRGRRRRWCSMKTCGNQAKAARYRSTHS